MIKLKLLLKMAASFLALLLLFIAFVFFVNREDRVPSESVLTLQRIAAAAPPVADRENGYIYILGFSASPNADVMQEGVARVERLRKFMEMSGTPGIDEMRAAARDDEQLIERYERLLEFKQWREIWPSGVPMPDALFGQVYAAQRLMYSRAMEDKLEAADCKRMLERDYRFWRMVLAESSSATVKMIAARSVELHFEMGNLLVRRFPAAAAMTAIPDAWREPISESERSMSKILANEWIGRLRPDDTRLKELMFGTFLYQPQATSNASADRLLRLAELFDRDYPAMPQAANTFLATYGVEKKAAADIGVYNPVGRMLLNMEGMDAYAGYGFRVANLEGIRRMVLLASQLRSGSVKTDGVVEWARASELRDPYDGKEFAWDQARNSLLFHRTLEGKPDFRIVY